MSAESNRENIRRHVDEIWNQGKLDLIPELLDPDYVAHSSTGADVKGPEGFRDQMVVVFRSLAPDLRYTIDSLIAEGDTVVARYTATGTSTGKFGNIEPTGKKFVQKSAVFHRFRNGKQVEAWSFTDSLSMYRQLGIPIPEPAAAAST